ncbi:MAG: polyphosphate polymerase domain-containing protein [Saccharospirillaceae bacterium]|nr:polyphosphate polymerase domain-containing protein [Pseudomonadales bacterium]NRB77942.1 polyphosphate polymerase domain-containing protein [Saccharospirillaceae bacterium]
MNTDQKNHINKKLNSFNSHSLSDLKKAELMDRVDTKFIVPIHLLDYIFDKINRNYTVLEINSKRIFEYQNTYYDTKDFIFYRNHHNGKLNRFKVRCRNYVDSDLSFLEVKFKNNKKRTYKTRIKVDHHPNEIIQKSKDFLNNAGITDGHKLVIVQKSGYHRIAFADEQNAERLTLDLNLHFSQPHQSNKQIIGEQVIFELKQNKLNRRSSFFDVMRQLGIKPSSFSKYCIGMALTYENKIIRKNNFNKVMRKISTQAVAEV